jgi:hypothetical protein
MSLLLENGCVQAVSQVVPSVTVNVVQYSFFEVFPCDFIQKWHTCDLNMPYMAGWGGGPKTALKIKREGISKIMVPPPPCYEPLFHFI